MRLISLNAWGGAMFGELAAWLPATDADVICLQEVTRTENMSGWTRFTDAERDLPQRADLYADLETLLPSYRGFFAASDAGPVHDANGRRHRQQFGLATFVRDDTTVEGCETSFVHGSFVEHADWPASGRPRVAQVMQIAEDDGATAGVVHLHGLRDATGKGDSPERLAQAQRVAGLVTAIANVDLRVVCGDLNLLPTSETFDVLRAVGMTDLVGTLDTRTSRYPKPIRHAGYLLVSDPTRVRSFTVQREPEVSDHAALVLELADVTTSGPAKSGMLER